MILHLDRLDSRSGLESTEYGTFGVLSLGSHRWTTVERPWEHNEPFVSCVPEGTYDLVPHDGKSGATWALVGETVAHYPDGKKPRSTCILEVANLANEVQGCIGVGTWFGHYQRQRAVCGSKDAMAELLDVLKGQPIHQLVIRDPRPLVSVLSI